MELAFVLAARQNQFFPEIVAAIRDELDQLGVASSVHIGAFPRERDDLVYVLVPPHEWFSLEGWRRPPTTNQLARSIFICAEQPGTAFFVDDARLGELAGAVFDINATSVREFARLGLAGVGHFPLGWTRTWVHGEMRDDLPSPDAHRDIDVLHLGIASQHRGEALGGAASWLAKWRCRLILADDDRPNSEQQANFAVADAKWDLLARSRVLLNVHVADRPYFEWLRVVQAICCGCVVVSEHSVGADPLQAGDHFVPARTEALGVVAHGVLVDEGHRAHIARQAHWFLRTHVPFSASVTKLANAAHDVLARRRREGRVPTRRLPQLMVAPFDDRAQQSSITQYPSSAAGRDASVLLAAVKDTRLELIEMRRDFDRLRKEVVGGKRVPVVEIDRASRAHAGAAPRVSVITPLYNYAHHVEAAFESIVAGRYRDVELIVVDDGSTDDSLAAARRFVAHHDGRAVLLLRHPVNRGLGVARNTALAFARGEFAFMLDADNEVYRHALERLVAALEASPDAAAAYGMLERFSADGPAGLVSQFPWRRDRFRTGNYIDAMAMWRTAILRRLGGFTTDRRLHGWEDYDLWCRLAESGGHAELVPEILARYRVTRHSMLAVTNISSTTAVSLLIERYPRLMAGVEPPL